jgi:hypothetical protein
MKIQIMFTTASIMLVASVLVFALPTPTPVQAAKSLWCSTTDKATGCFTDQGSCEKWRVDHLGAAPCQKAPIKKIENVL